MLATSAPLLEQFSLTSRLWKSALSQTLAICVQAPSLLPPSPLPPKPLSPILTLIAVDHVAKFTYIVFIDLHLLAFHKCRYSSLNLGVTRRRDDTDNEMLRMDELLIGVKNAMRLVVVVFFGLCECDGLGCKRSCTRNKKCKWGIIPGSPKKFNCSPIIT